MKKTFLLLCLCTFFHTNTFSQNVVKEFFKAQSSKGENRDTLQNEKLEDNKISDAIHPSHDTTHESVSISINEANLRTISQNIFLFRQDYCLYDRQKKKFYGYDHQEQFGKSISIGVRCENFNILMDAAIHPWNYDSNYLLFKGLDLEPVITASYHAWVNDNEIDDYTRLETPIKTFACIKNESVYTISPWDSIQSGFLINTADTCKEGMILWVVSDIDKDSGNAVVDFKYTGIIHDMYSSVIVTPPVDSSKIIGGIYLVETNEGYFPYQLAGLVIMRDELWILSFPFKGFTMTDSFMFPPEVEKLTEIEGTPEVTAP